MRSLYRITKPKPNYCLIVADSHEAGRPFIYGETILGKGFGIAGLIILLISFPIPIVGTFVGYFALILVTVAALCGHKTLVVATTVLAAIKMYMLSPALMATMYSSEGVTYLLVTTFFAVLPIAALLFRPLILVQLRVIGLVKSSPPASTDEQ